MVRDLLASCPDIQTTCKDSKGHEKTWNNLVSLAVVNLYLQGTSHCQAGSWLFREDMTAIWAATSGKTKKQTLSQVVRSRCFTTSNIFIHLLQKALQVWLLSRGITYPGNECNKVKVTATRGLLHALPTPCPHLELRIPTALVSAANRSTIEYCFTAHWTNLRATNYAINRKSDNLYPSRTPNLILHWSNYIIYAVIPDPLWA